MSEEEFFNRLLNKIAKEFGYDTASSLELMFRIREKKVEQLEKELDRLNNIIKELSKDVDMWNKKYNEQFNIINELENFINNEIFTSLDKKHVFNEEADTFYKVLDKLKALKENNK